MLVNNKVLVVMFFYSIGLSGCAPSYSTWEGGLNEVIGDAFERHYKNPHSLFWAPIYSNKEKRFADKVVYESSWKRYYLTWMKQCKYSVLVDDKGVIRSWRYETDDRGSCYVW